MTKEFSEQQIIEMFGELTMNNLYFSSLKEAVTCENFKNNEPQFSQVGMWGIESDKWKNVIILFHIDKLKGNCFISKIILTTEDCPDELLDLINQYKKMLNAKIEKI